MSRVELRTTIAAPIEVVFDLARSIDAHLESMSASRERAIGGVTEGLIERGEEVTWRARHFGVPFTVTSRIVEMDRPTWFVDAQTRGPFKRFRHEHRFVAVGAMTEMTDSIEFASPMGAIGRVVDRLGLARYLTNLIHARNQHLKAAAESRMSDP